MNMATETFLTTSYTIVDDWYQSGSPSSRSRRGKTRSFHIKRDSSP